MILSRAPLGRRIALLAIAVAGLVAAIWWLRSPGPSQRVVDSVRTIYVVSAVEIGPIADLRQGFREVLDKSSIKGEVRYVERNAQNDPGITAQIADEIARVKPALVYVLGSSVAQAIQKRAPGVIVVQGGVTDPVSAGLATAWSGSGRLYAATSDRPPMAKLISVITELLPNRKKIGVLYNPSEPNSVAVVAELRSLAKVNGLEVQEFAVGQASDLPAAAAAAARNSQIVFVPPDNAVTAGLAAVIQAASMQGVPVVATTDDAVKQGAFLAVTTNYVTLGRESGALALEILVGGRNPGEIPIRLPQDARIVVSKRQAKRFGVDITGDRSKGLEIFD